MDDAGRLITHPLGERILGGITRQVLLELARADGIEVVMLTGDRKQTAEAMASEIDIALHLSVGLMQLEQGERPKKMDF